MLKRVKGNVIVWHTNNPNDVTDSYIICVMTLKSWQTYFCNDDLFYMKVSNLDDDFFFFLPWALILDNSIMWTTIMLLLCWQ